MERKEGRPGLVDIENPKTGLPELDDDPSLFKLMLATLEQFINQVARGDEAQLAAFETSSDRFVQGFKRERLDLGYEEARQALLAAPSDAERYALGWVGYLTVQGVRYEAMLVGGGTRGKARGAILGQRYKKSQPDARFQRIGNLAVLGPGDNLLTLAGDPEAAAKLRPLFERVTAEVDHDQSKLGDKALVYEFRQCQELVLSFGQLDLPFRKELQKKPDMVHVVMDRRAWATVFKPEATEVYLDRDALVPIRGGQPFPGFHEDGVILLGYMPPIPTENSSSAVGLFVLWMASFKVTDKGTKWNGFSGFVQGG